MDSGDNLERQKMFGGRPTRERVMDDEIIATVASAQECSSVLDESGATRREAEIGAREPHYGRIDLDHVGSYSAPLEHGREGTNSEADLQQVLGLRP